MEENVPFKYDLWYMIHLRSSHSSLSLTMRNIKVIQRENVKGFKEIEHCSSESHFRIIPAPPPSSVSFSVVPVTLCQPVPDTDDPPSDLLSEGQ